MTFSPAVKAELPTFYKKKVGQWERVKGALPGLQLAMTAGHETMLTYSPHDESFYEGVIIGQLPKIFIEEYGSKLNPQYRDIAEEKKPHTHQRVDFTDDQVDQIIAQWRAGKSALELPFVEAVYVHGQRKTR